MIRPYFVFTKLQNSFCVHVKNLENLSIEQIQAIESFVKERKGVFDFNSYTFVIQKRLEFNEFVSLIQNASLQAVCQEKVLRSQSNERISFGKYKGVAYRDLPDSYLLWLKSNYKGANRELIDAEINYRRI